MGMYNEVFKKCECGKKCEMQVGQVELGFGGYDLDNPHTMSHLSFQDRKILARMINGNPFRCEDCGYFAVHVRVAAEGEIYI